MPENILTAIADTVIVVPVKPDDLKTAEFALDGLCEKAAELLATAYATSAGATDARVRDLPDARTVRYYQTIGLLDRPLRYDGRKAVYGYRHLLQTVCVKLLQARGLSLVQVQQVLSVASTAKLEAAVEEALGGGVDQVRPAAPVGPEATPVTPAPPESSLRWLTVELAPGVLVSLDPRRHPNPEPLLSRLQHAVGMRSSTPTPGDRP